MKYAVADLEGALLDRAVELAEGIPSGSHGAWPFSTDWQHGGPIIERERMQVGFNSERECWTALHGDTDYGHGRTPLIAAMRAYVASRFGQEVELPGPTDPVTS